MPLEDDFSKLTITPPPHKGWDTKATVGPEGTIVRSLDTGWGPKPNSLSHKINGGKKQKSKRKKSRSNKRKNRRATKTRRYK